MQRTEEKEHSGESSCWTLALSSVYMFLACHERRKWLPIATQFPELRKTREAECNLSERNGKH